MAKGYIHVEIEASQASKRAGNSCGDVVAYDRTSSSTTIILCDGIGHGIKAHIYAQMCVSRILELLRQGESLRNTFTSLVATMERARGTDMPYAVFTVVRILNDGVATVLSYEMPAPIFVTSRYAQVLPQRTVNLEQSLIGEANCHVAPGEGILIVTDGITQAGLGMGLTHGWTIEGASQYISDCISDRAQLVDLPNCVLRRARELWKKTLGDDCSAVLASCRHGKIVNIFTGPPTDKTKDKAVINRFLRADGTKIVCGGSTSQIVAKHMGTEVIMEPNPQSMLAPPRYLLPGIDLVTEGAVTLNQVYNVLDEDSNRFAEESGVTELHDYLINADRVNITMGSALNPATADISFRQKGILTRQRIIPLIAAKLQEMGKLVTVEQV